MFIWKEPSPSTSTTFASGRAAFTPIAEGSPNPIVPAPSELMTDYDKLIDRQLERASISAVTGFAKIFSDASKKLTIS